MPWLQLIVNTQRENAEALEDAVLAAGAVSVTMTDNADQAILEPAVGETPLWQQTQITGLFNADTDTTTATLLATAHYQNTLPHYRWELLEDKDWERAWMDNYQAMRFGQRLWICPSWKTPPEPEAVNLMLDPGLAFGTGTHPTTALCLQWLDQHDLQGKQVIDYGAGSGILAIAALLLGAEKVIAIDNDPQALVATKDNAKRNNIHPSRLETYLPDELPEGSKCDILLANILAQPLIELAPHFNSLLKPKGALVLSGILETQVAKISEHYQSWLNLEAGDYQQEWARLSGYKR